MSCAVAMAAPGWQITTRRLGEIYPPNGLMQHPIVSPGGRHVAWITRDDRQGPARYFLTLDGQPQTAFPGPLLWPKYPFSADGRQLAYLARDAEGRYHAVSAGQTGPPFSFIIPQSMRLSGDGRHLAYLAESPEGWRLVADGTVGAGYPWLQTFQRRWGTWGRKQLLEDGSANDFWSLSDRLMLMSDPAEPLLVSPDGQHMACVVVQPDRSCFAVVDGQEGKRYQDIWLLRFSADSRHLTYWARENYRWVIVRDGQETERFDNLYSPTLSPDGRRFACVARLGARQIVVIDDEPPVQWEIADTRLPDENDLHFTLQFSPDSRRLAYQVRQGDRWCMVIDGQCGKDYDTIWGFTFSPDGAHYAYTGIRRNKRCAIVDGKEGIGYDKVSDPLFSPDGSRLAYAAKRGDLWRLVVDGTEDRRVYTRVLANPNVPSACSLAFSPDSKHWAFFGEKNNRWRVVRDGRESDPYTVVDSGSLLFSPDGAHLAWTAKVGDAWSQIIDDTVRATGDEVTPVVFSPDSRHSAGLVRRGTQWTAVIDGLPGDPYAAILGWHDDGVPRTDPKTVPQHWLVFDDDTHYHYFARTADAVYRIDGVWGEQ